MANKPRSEVRPIGRPLKYRSAHKLQIKVDEYFTNCEIKDIPPTITGFALHLGMTRKMLLEYEDRKDFRNVIMSGKARVQTFVEQQMISGKAGAGAIFWMKNHGWQDKQIVETSTSDMDKDQLAAKLASILKS